MEMNRFHFRDPVFGINNRFGMGKIERDLLYDRHRDDVLREINQLNYGKNNLDLFYKTNFYKNTGSEKIELNGINRLGIGKKNGMHIIVQNRLKVQELFMILMMSGQSMQE